MYLTLKKYFFLKYCTFYIFKQWNEISTTIAYQTSIPGLEVIDPSLKESYFTLEEYFPLGSKVFVLDAPFYGCQADVLGGFISSRVKINIILEPEPYIHELKERLESVSTELFYGKFFRSYYFEFFFKKMFLL